MPAVLAAKTALASIDLSSYDPEQSRLMDERCILVDEQDNAIGAMEKDGQLTIETTLDERNANICIIDNGSGIPKEIMSRIFDPFFTTKKVGEGTGIGLDIVNRVVKRHNGTIEVVSEPGRTEFMISLPVIQKERPAIKETTNSTS